MNRAIVLGIVLLLAVGTFAVLAGNKLVVENSKPTFAQANAQADAGKPVVIIVEDPPKVVIKDDSPVIIIVEDP